MCSSIFTTVLLVAFVVSPILSQPIEQNVTPSDHVIISDGNEIRLHSRSSQKTSSSLGIRSPAKITSLDYFQARDDFLDIVWADANGDDIHMNTINVNDKTVTHSEILKGQLLSNITSVAVLRSEPERIMVTSHVHGDDRGMIVATNLDTRKDCVWVNDVVKPGQLVTGSLSHPFQILWISEKRCVEGLSRSDAKVSIVCVDHLKNVPTTETTLESISIFNDQLFLIMSSGQLFWGGPSWKTFIEVSYMDDRKMNRGFNQIDLIRGSNGIELYVSNKIDGTLNQVILSDELKAFKSSTSAVERSIFDFKLIQDKHNGYEAKCFEVEQNEMGELGKVIEIVEETIGADDSTLVGYAWIQLTCILLIVSLMLITALMFLHRRNRDHEPRRLLGRNLNSSMDEDPIIKVSSGNKCISIEDLGGFVNPGWSSSSSAQGVSNPCDSCDYRGECSERGMCLNTFRLLHNNDTHHHT